MVKPQVYKLNRSWYTTLRPTGTFLLAYFYEKRRKYMVHAAFINYFIATASAGAALIGLLFVSVSIAPHRTVRASGPYALAIDCFMRP
jgi:hypothetical protein